MSPLTNEEKRLLLRLSRQALEARLGDGRTVDPQVEPGPDESKIPPRLRERAGVFVSLHESGELRGCVGFVESRLPLYRAVMDAALAAALDDPRFPPVCRAELYEIDIEISVLSSPHPITPGEIRIGIHGLMITQGKVRGLLLPQVAAERNWDPERFLEETCRKAGIASDAWRTGARAEAFEAEVFGEKQVNDQRSAGQALL